MSDTHHPPSLQPILEEFARSQVISGIGGLSWDDQTFLPRRSEPLVVMPSSGCGYCTFQLEVKLGMGDSRDAPVAYLGVRYSFLLLLNERNSAPS